MSRPFTSDRRWCFGVEPHELWTTISRTEDFRRWWPWLRRLDADGLKTGGRWQCLVQPPLPYAVRFTIDLDLVEEARLAEATVSGDIRGSARLDVVPTDDGCEARLISSLEPHSPVLRGVGRVARPVIAWGHDWVLDQGARQFASRAFG